VSDKELLKDARYNFWHGVVNGALFRCGSAFFSADVIIPSYISDLANRANWVISTSIIVSFATVAQVLGWRLPQFFIANHIEVREKKLPIYKFASSSRVVTLILLVFSIFILGENHLSLLLGISLLSFILFGFFGSISGTTYMDIVGKAIPANKRGKYYRNRNVIGGMLVFIFSGPLISYIQESAQEQSFLYSYMLFFICAIPIMFLAFVAFFRVREPLEPPIKRRFSMKEHFRRTPQLFRNDQNYRRYVITRICVQCINLATPFFMLYAKEVLQVPSKMQGVFTSAIGISGAVALFLWAFIADNYGNRLLMQISVLTTMLAPLLASLSKFMPTDKLYILVFVFLGASRFGIFVSTNNYLLEIAPSEKRIIYIGLSNSLSSPFTLMPMLGGYIVSRFSYQACFITSIIFGIIAFYLTFKLNEPRGKLA